MNTIEILDDTKHQELNIDFKAARRASRPELIPVVISEFHSLMFHYPILFVKDKETAEFTCSILLATSLEANLLDQGDASDDSLPLNIRRLPLLAIEAQNGATRPLVGINKSSPGVNVGKGGGDYIFKNKSESFDAAVSALVELYDGYKQTRAFVKKIVELDLISKLQVEIRYPDKPRHILEGLYSVDMNKIARISEGDSATKNSFLEIASYVYAQNFSLYNMKKLAPIVS